MLANLGRLIQNLNEYYNTFSTAADTIEPSGSKTFPQPSEIGNMSSQGCDENGSSTSLRRSQSGSSACRIRSQNEFVFARCVDGYYRPGSIIRKSKKLQEFIVFYYHDNSCCRMKPKDVLVKHGNLVDQQALFFADGCWRKGKVYGNNSPANHGFPRTFFIRKRGRWFRVNFRSMLLTRRQVVKITCKRGRNRCDGDGPRERRVKFLVVQQGKS